MFSIDPHARDLNGMPNLNGTAIVIKFTSILDIEQCLPPFPSAYMSIYLNL